MVIELPLELPLEGLYLKILQWDTFFKKNSFPIIFAKCSFFVEIRCGNIFLTPLFQRICGNIFLTITFSTDLWQHFFDHHFFNGFVATRKIRLLLYTTYIYHIWAIV